MIVKLVHDFICPWCWIGLFQAQRLQKEFGVEIEWVGAELYPEELKWPEPRIIPPEPTNKPPIKSRLQFLEFIDQIPVPRVEKPKRMRIHNAHLAVEFAKKHGDADKFVEALYRSYWEAGLEINAIPILKLVAEEHGLDADAMVAAIEAEEGADTIYHFDKPAYKQGIYNVPTFFIGDERLAEQPYGEIAAAVERNRVKA